MERKPPTKKTIFSPRYELFLTQLKAARVKAGLSQRQAAKLLGRPQSFVSKSENNERRVDMVELIDFLKAYGAPLQEFVTSLATSLGENEK